MAAEYPEFTHESLEQVVLDPSSIAGRALTEILAEPSKEGFAGPVLRFQDEIVGAAYILHVLISTRSNGDTSSRAKSASIRLEEIKQDARSMFGAEWAEQNLNF